MTVSRSVPERRLLQLALAVTFTVAAVLFAIHAASRVANGLGSADDAYIAMAAKSLADGRGYGVPASDTQFVPFDVAITSGLPLVLPLAAAIALFGVHDLLPGLVALAVFLVQLSAAALIASRLVGRAAAVALAAAFLLMAVVSGRVVFLYGVFLGEPIAAGFVLLMALTLAASPSRRALVAAGILGACAVLTKLIAALAVGGVVLGWLVLQWRAGRRPPVLLAGAALLMIGLLAPLAAFELAKWSALGLDAYVANWRSAVALSGVLGTPVPGIVERVVEIGIQVDQLYIRLALAAVLVTGFLVLLRSRARISAPAPVIATALLLSFAVAAHFAYMLARETVAGRYFAVGVVLAGAMVALGVVTLHARARLAALAFVLVASAVLDPPAIFDRRGPDPTDVHAERLAAVAVLDANQGTPYGAGHWSSLYTFVFQRQDEGRFAWGDEVARDYGARFLAVVDRPFTMRLGPFIDAVDGTCSTLTPAAVRVQVYECGEQFWHVLFPPAPLSAVNGPVDGGVRDAESCNVDYFDTGRPRGVPLVVPAGDVIPVRGWAADFATASRNRSIVIAIVESGGNEYSAPVSIEERPDFAASQGQPSLSPSGFRGALSFGGVPAGRYRLYADLHTDGGLVRCNTRLVLDVV